MIVSFPAGRSPPPSPRPGEALAAILTWAALHQRSDGTPETFLRLVMSAARQYTECHGIDGLLDKQQRPQYLLLTALADLDPGPGDDAA
jgi:hypothetical protein